MNFMDWANRNRWIWSVLGVLILWGILSAVTSQLSLSSLSGVAVTGSFLTLVALAYFWRKVPETKGRSLQEIEHDLTGSKA